MTRGESEISAGNVEVPRWVITLFSWLLPVVAVTCFIFGLMVGGKNQDQSPGPESPHSCSLTVIVQEHAQSKTGSPIVVLLLPQDGTMANRCDPKSILPENFQPLNNPSIEAIVAAGGVVSRTNDAGTAYFTVDSERSYWLVVLSDSLNDSPPRRLTRAETAAMSQYFLPVEGLFRSGLSHLELVEVTGQQMTFGPLELE